MPMPNGEVRILTKIDSPPTKTIPPTLKMPRVPPKVRARVVAKVREKVRVRGGGGGAREAPPLNTRDA